MVADSFDVVIGVDTHRDAHSLALVRCRDAVLIAEQELPATRAGYRAALRLGKRSGRRRLWALEGTGSYGAGLARFLAERGEQVREVERPAREGSRHRLKSDSLDACAPPGRRSPGRLRPRLVRLAGERRCATGVRSRLLRSAVARVVARTRQLIAGARIQRRSTTRRPCFARAPRAAGR